MMTLVIGVIVYVVLGVIVALLADRFLQDEDFDDSGLAIVAFGWPCMALVALAWVLFYYPVKCARRLLKTGR